MLIPMNNLEKKSESRPLSFHEKIYLKLDYIKKILFDFLDELYTAAFGTISGILGLIINTVSEIIGFLLRTSPEILKKRPSFLTLLKGAVLLPLIFVTALVALIVTLFIGFLSGIFGFRNIADYSQKEQWAVWALPVLLLLCAPLYCSEYFIYKISLICIFSVGVIGLDFLYGQCGIISLGQGAFLMTGAYFTTWLCNGTFGYQFPFLIALILGALFNGVIGTALGIPGLRVKDYYLVIISMTFSLAAPKIMRAQVLAEYSGLRQGGLYLRELEFPLLLEKIPVPFLKYLIVVIPAVFLIWFAYNIIHRSQIGRAFRAIKCDNEVSMIMGIPVVRYKLLAFILSGVYAGFAGGLLLVANTFVSPESYSTTTSIDYLVALVIGGPGSIVGSVFGGFFLTYEPDLTQFAANLLPGGKSLARGAYGVLLIVIISFAPKGVAGGLATWLKSKFKKPVRRGSFQVAPPADYDVLKEKKSFFPPRYPEE